MAPKALSLSHQPSKEDREREEPSSDEEEESEEESQAHLTKEEQENSSDETEEGSSEDDDEDQENAKSNISTPVPKLDSKSINQENGSDSEPDSEGSPSDYKLQPIRKPSTSLSKRSRQEGAENQDSLKRYKNTSSEEKKSSSTPSAGCITRLWSNEDEIAVLNGMIDFRNAKGLDPNADMVAFYNFIKAKLQVDFTKDQLRTKITRMKKRFFNALKKGGTGSDPVFSKPHEDMAFELSKKVWGRAVDSRVAVKNENAKKDIVKAEKGAVDEKVIVKKENDGEDGEFWSKYPFLSASFRNMGGNFPALALSEAGVSFVKEQLSLIGDEKAKELDEKWKRLMVEEMELNHKMLALMIEQEKMALNP